MKLTQDCIDAIDEHILSTYDGYPHYMRLDVKANMVDALSNREFTYKAGLIPLEEAFEFAQWVATNHFKWDANYLKFVDDRKYHNKYYTRVELYDLFQLSKPIV